MLLAIFHEWFRKFRINYQNEKMQVTSEEMLQITTLEESEAGECEKQHNSDVLDLKIKLVLTCMYMFQTLVGYSLMLAAMTMNVTIFTSIIIGFSMGYFFCGISF